MPRCDRSRSLAFAVVVSASATSLALACTSAKSPRGDVLDQGAPHPLVNRAAPSFVAKTITGEDVALHTPSDRVTVVHFWATWTDASRQTLPKLERIFARYHASGVDVIAFSVDDTSDPIDELVSELGVTYPVAWDDRKAMVRHWLAREVPATFIVDRRGVVRAAFLGADDGFEFEVETDVRILAKESDAPHAS